MIEDALTRSSPDRPDKRQGGSEPRASMRDVAAASGVSVSTVSRALSNAPGISEASRRQIARVAAELGYDRTALARPVKHQSVLIVVPLQLFSSDGSGFYRQILEAAEDELDRRHVPFETLLFDADASDTAPLLERCPPEASVGVLCVAIDEAALIAAARARASGVVLVNGVDPAMQVDSVAPANRRGAEIATLHLIERGHRRIAHITALRRRTIRDRLEGYRAALKASEIAYDDALVFDIPALQPDDAATAVRKAIRHGRLDGVSAIFCGNDMVAAGVIKALSEFGRRVPQDCSVIGFDDTRVTARMRPRLTTVAVDMREIGRQSVRRMLERLETPELSQAELRIGCRLVERESVLDHAGEP